jgi:hypothetical protein
MMASTFEGAWRPFIDPIHAHDWWFLLLLPMAVFISIAYKAVRMPDLAGFWRQVAVMTVQIILGMLALAVAFYLLVQVYVRWWTG